MDNFHAVKPEESSSIGWDIAIESEGTSFKSHRSSFCKSHFDIFIYYLKVLVLKDLVIYEFQTFLDERLLLEESWLFQASGGFGENGVGEFWVSLNPLYLLYIHLPLSEKIYM